MIVFDDFGHFCFCSGEGGLNCALGASGDSRHFLERAVFEIEEQDCGSFMVVERLHCNVNVVAQLSGGVGGRVVGLLGGVFDFGEFAIAAAKIGKFMNGDGEKPG